MAAGEKMRIAAFRSQTYFSDKITSFKNVKVEAASSRN
jgi:hypothetical protein